MEIKKTISFTPDGFNTLATLQDAYRGAVHTGEVIAAYIKERP